MSRDRTGPVIAAVVIIAVAIMLALAVGSWIYGLYWQDSKIEVYMPLTIRLDTPDTIIQQPIRGYIVFNVWSDPVGPGTYKVVITVTALKDLGQIRIHAAIANRTGQPPVNAANANVTWEYVSLPEGWYTSQYWTPIDRSDYPVTITMGIYFRER